MLDNYIKRNGQLDGITKDKTGFKIWYHLKKVNKNIYESAFELGYDLNDISKRKPKGYYDVFKNLAMDIEELIEAKYKRFPLVTEIKRELRISSRIIKKHGNINEIKRKMGYLSDSVLVDLTGYVNKSVWELITANFLYLNNVEFKRNQLLFTDKKYTYRSDFYFNLSNSENVHVELWGHTKKKRKAKWNVREAYLEQRTEKERIYKEYKIPYKSLEGYEIFHNNSYNYVQERLIKVFSFLNIPLNKVDNSMLVPVSPIKTEEILDKVMAFSDQPNTLPSTQILQKKDIQTYLLVKKHFGTWMDFAKVVQKDTLRLDNYWTKESIMALMEAVYKKYGYIPSYDYMRGHVRDNQLFEKIVRGFYRFPDFLNIKLAFYRNKLEQKNLIPDKEIIWLTQVANSVGSISPHINEEHKKKASLLINYIDNKVIEEVINKDNNKKDAAFEKEIFALFDHLKSKHGSMLISYGKYNKLKKEDSFLKGKSYYHRKRALGRLHEWRIRYLKREIEKNSIILEEEMNYLLEISAGETNNQFKPTNHEINLAKNALYLL